MIASTSDLLLGFFPRKHADVAAMGLMPMPSHFLTMLSRVLPYVGSYSLNVGGMALCLPLSLSVTRIAWMFFRSLFAFPMMLVYMAPHTWSLGAADWHASFRPLAGSDPPVAVWPPRSPHPLVCRAQIAQHGLPEVEIAIGDVLS